MRIVWRLLITCWWDMSLTNSYFFCSSRLPHPPLHWGFQYCPEGGVRKGVTSWHCEDSDIYGSHVVDDLVEKKQCYLSKFIYECYLYCLSEYWRKNELIFVELGNVGDCYTLYFDAYFRLYHTLLFSFFFHWLFVVSRLWLPHSI